MEKENEYNNFTDERSKSGLRDLLLSFKCLDKLQQGKFTTLTYKEMWALYDVGYLDFDNSYGEEIPAIGHLTQTGAREVFEHYRDEIMKKTEHIITKTLNY